MTILTDIKNITLNTNFLELQPKDGVIIRFNIIALLSAPLDSEEAWVRVTDIAKAYNIDPKDYLRRPATKEYHEATLDEYFIQGSSSLFKIPKIMNDYYTEDGKPKLSITKRGKHQGGTWLHATVIIDFIRYLDVRFAVKMDRLMRDILTQANHLKIDRANSIKAFHPLTDAIKEHIVPTLSDNGKKFIYSTIMDFVNKKVMNKTAKVIREERNIPKEDAIRDYFTNEELDLVIEYEKSLHGFIEYANIITYDGLQLAFDRKY